MRCDCCPLCPLSEDDICPESEGKYGIEHSDGMLGCKHPYNWAKKRGEAYDEYLGNMGTDMGIEMTFTHDELNQVLEICKHMIGLDYKRPYHRHGKAFYNPYRNYYEAPLSGNLLLDRLPQHIVKVENCGLSVRYTLTNDGLRWLGRQVGLVIKPVVSGGKSIRTRVLKQRTSDLLKRYPCVKDGTDLVDETLKEMVGEE